MDICKHLAESQKGAAHLYSTTESLGSGGELLLGYGLWPQLHKVPCYSFLTKYVLQGLEEIIQQN